MVYNAFVAALWHTFLRLGLFGSSDLFLLYIKEVLNLIIV
jgi:hypothetical protein